MSGRLHAQSRTDSGIVSDKAIYRPACGQNFGQVTSRRHERSIGEYQRQGTEQPDSEGQFDGTAYGAKAQPSNDVGKHSAGQKREWAGQGNCSSFGPFPPDFRIRVAPMEPITREEPVG
jgi:hypothetical protein